MTLKKREDWPVRDLQLDPFEVWKHYDKKSNLWVLNQNGVVEHFGPTLQTFGEQKGYKLSRDCCCIF